MGFSDSVASVAAGMETLVVIVIVILSIVSDTLARIGVVKVADPDHSEKATNYEDTACYSYDRVIVPKIAQNSNGQIKFISQDNSTHSDLQPVSISLCSNPGSSCLGCIPTHLDQQVIPDKVCQQEYREVVMVVMGENGRDFVDDTFLMPDGCTCTSR